MRMANSVLMLRAIGAQMFRERSQLTLVIALIALAVARLLPATSLQSVDRILGRPGDTFLLLVAFLLGWLLYLAASKSTANTPKPSVGTSLSNESVKELLEIHLQLDHEIDKKLVEVTSDTETSALNIINQVRGLYDTANGLVEYLNSSSPQANNMGKEIVGSVAYLVEIGDFIEQLPGKMTRDMDIVQSVVKEIADLNDMVGAVQAISMQSHLLAINAAIEGSRAGPSGDGFRVIAQEMRKLASDSSGVASKIKVGLTRARHVVHDGMSNSIAESTQQLERVSHAVASIQKLRENFEDMSQYFKTRLTVVTKHNEDLSKDILDVFGHLQYQDVVGQCIERIRKAIGQRNAFLQNAASPQTLAEAEPSQLPDQLALIWTTYLAEEKTHKHSARHEADASTEPKFELF